MQNLAPFIKSGQDPLHTSQEASDCLFTFPEAASCPALHASCRLQHAEQVAAAPPHWCHLRPTSHTAFLMAGIGISASTGTELPRRAQRRRQQCQARAETHGLCAN